MRNSLIKCVGGLLAVLGFIFVPADAGAQTPSSGTPIPTAVGPIPVTAESFPQMTVKRMQQVVDLEGAGYVEEEFFVSGSGNAYDWAQDGSLSVIASGLPYTTRVMVRRPANVSRFSGNVVVELINNSRTYDWPMAWSVLFPHILESGHAYVGISIRPRGIDVMKKFNPTRYEPLSFGAPQQPCPGATAAADRREDVHWDIISQVGALLKTARTSGPLAGFTVQRTYVTADDGDVATYVNAIHAHAKMADGRSIYDGYLHKGNAYPVRINACAEAPGASDPRRKDRGANVPVVRVLTEGDVLTSFAMRRDDSDAPGDLYRLYEVPGSSHMDSSYYRHLPIVEDQTKMGQPAFTSAWPIAYKCAIDIAITDAPLYRYAMNAALANVDRWVREGTPAPRGQRVEVRNGGTPQAAFVFDEFGNAVGGVRSPYLEVPAATYRAKTPGQGVCGNLLSIVPFDWARLEKLYGSHTAYATKVGQAVDRLVAQRWLTRADGEKIKRDAVAPGTGSSR
jgi:hypothetical protein